MQKWICIYSRWDVLFISRPTDSHYLHLHADVSASVIFFSFSSDKITKDFQLERGKKREKENIESKMVVHVRNQIPVITNIFHFQKKVWTVTYICFTSFFFPLNKLADNRWLWHGLPYPSSSGLCQKQTWRPYTEFLPFQFWEYSHHKLDSASSVHVSLLCFQHKRFCLLGSLFPLNLKP